MWLASWNLRYDTISDNISVEDSLKNLPDNLAPPKKYQNVTGEVPWSTRRIKVVQQLLSDDIVLAGFQEALSRQVDDLQKLLGADRWNYVGVGRDDGKTRGEYSPIFYRSELKMISSDTFWLSKTPFTPSKYPGAGCIRICTVARFSQSSNAQSATPEFVLLNTHLDHASEDQRKYGASMVLARARFEAATLAVPVFVTGDFNSSSFGKDSGAYKIMTGEAPPVAISREFSERFDVPQGRLPDFRLLDVRACTDVLNVSGNFGTFTGFKGPENSSKETDRIDFIFGCNGGGWRSECYKVPSALSDDGILASDHRPVIARLSL